MNTNDQSSNSINITDQALYASMLAHELFFRNERPFFALTLGASHDSIVELLRSKPARNERYGYPNDLSEATNPKRLNYLQHTDHFISLFTFYFDGSNPNALESIDLFVGFYPDQSTSANRDTVFVTLIEYLNSVLGQYERTHHPEGTSFAWKTTVADREAEYYLLFYNDAHLATLADNPQNPVKPQLKLGYQYL